MCRARVTNRGILPVGLGVRRRAARLHRRLLERQRAQGLEAMEYVKPIAMAVPCGRVVTAPTNGAADVRDSSGAYGVGT
jgi:L-serine dehydratase